MYVRVQILYSLLFVTIASSSRKILKSRGFYSCRGNRKGATPKRSVRCCSGLSAWAPQYPCGTILPVEQTCVRRSYGVFLNQVSFNAEVGRCEVNKTTIRYCVCVGNVAQDSHIN